MKKQIGLLALLLGVAAPMVKADDTEIYLSQGNFTAPPLVMFHLEYTSNLTSTICTGVTGQDAATLASQCSTMVPLAGYFKDTDFADSTLTSFEMLRAALKKVLAPLGDVKVGFMLAHDDNNKCTGPGTNAGCSNGGYILKGFTELTRPENFDRDNPDLTTLLANDAAKRAFFEMLDALPEPQGNLAHPNQNKEVYFELFRYLTGQRIYNAHNGWVDFATTSAYNLGDASDVSTTVPDGTGPLKWDTTIETGNSYRTPLTEDCVKIFVINILDGGGNAANGSDDAISASLDSGGMGLNISNGDAGYVQMVRWLHDKDLADGTINSLSLSDRQNITSFYIAKQPQQVDEAAAAGGTGYALEITDDPSDVIDTLDKVFNQILSVSTTFVSASIPVNVFNRSEVLDNVYIALFQANADRQPQWVGNIKKLKISAATVGTTDGGTEVQLRLVDALGNPAISTIDGRINYDALTFWTDAYGADVQEADPDESEVVGRDGRSVDRGGAGQRIPGFLADTPTVSNADNVRKLYTENGGGLYDLEANSTVAQALWPELSNNSAGSWNGSFDIPTGDWATDSTRYWRENTVTLEQEAVKLLKFIRGFDVNDTDQDGSTTDSRRWLFGDPLHSRPLPINYGGEDQIRLVVGSNDGFLRMFQNTDSGGGELGTELWAFMPRPMLRIQKQLMDNAVASGDTPSHPYGVDGPPTAYVKDEDHNGVPEAVWVYFGLRRGGRAYYALDITNYEQPQLLWSITNVGDFADLGLTFSTPTVRTLDYGSGPKPVVIFAGGYDPDKDAESLGTNDDEGNALYIVDAQSGALVWRAVASGVASQTTYVQPSLLDSIPSEVTAVDTTGNGSVDRIYVGDTGGVIWRADLPGNNPTEWTMEPILSVGRHHNNTLENDRRFFHRPDFVMAHDDAGDYDAVIIGSGNRAHPLNTATVDWVYTLKDRETTSGAFNAALKTHDSLQDVTDDCLQESSVTCAVGFSLTDGWKLRLEATGEKSLASPMTLLGKVYFNTYVPPGPDSDGVTCGPAEGSGYFYVVALGNANSVFNYDTTNDAADQDLFKSDRKRELLSGGIPSENVYIAYRPPGADNSAGNEAGNEGGTIRCVMATDFSCNGDQEQMAWRTFWYTVGPD